jgi:lysozyme
MRFPISSLQPSEEGVSLIKQFEGFKSEAYLDIVGVPTIGYGHTLNVKLGDVIDEKGAFSLLKEELIHTYHPILNKACKVPLNQFEYDAYLSLIYNIGGGNFTRSTLLRRLNNKEYEAAAEQILVWNRAGGKKVQGLVNRRKREYQHCIKGFDEN